MGGMDGFGPVEPEPNEPMFHAEWEARVLGDDAGDGRRRRLEHRHVALRPRESLPPHVYLASSYYRIWLLGARGHAGRTRAVRRDEIAAGHAAAAAESRSSAASSRRDDVARVMVRGRFDRRERRRPPQFKPAIACAPRTSTRRPTRGCRAMCAGMSAWSSAIMAVMCFRTRNAIGAGRESAMALHRRVRRARTVGRGRRSDASRSRSTRWSRIWSRPE